MRMKLQLVLALFIAGCASTPPPAESDLQPLEPRPAPTLSPPAAQPHRFDARLTLFDYPHEVKTFRFEAQSQEVEMAYMDVAPTAAANGHTVLLLHGKNFSGAYWEDTIEALAARGYRVVVPDQIGFGKSSKPQRYQFTFQALARHTAALLDEIAVESVAVVGHSMGGMLATRFALMYPERTTKLALVNPIGLEDWKLVVGYTTIDEWYQSELEKTPDGVRNYMKSAYFDGQWKPEYDQLAELQIGWSEGPDKERIAWVSALTFDMIFTQPVLYEFGQLQTPTLLIIGQRDRTALGKNKVPAEVADRMGRYPQLGRAADAAIPDSELVELDAIGHVPQFEAWPAYIAALSAFLDK